MSLAMVAAERSFSSALVRVRVRVRV